MSRNPMDAFAGTPTPSPAAQPPVQAGPGAAPAAVPAIRAQLLATEHWSLLATRSTTQSEVLSRITTFLMLISASVISLGLIGQVARFGVRFITFALVVLTTDLVIGTLTQLRVHNASTEDLALVIGMNRLRAAYTELDPAIERYLVTSAHDDTAGIWQTYNHLAGPNPSQRYASAGAFITFLTSGLAAAIAAIAAAALHLPSPVAAVIAAAVGLGFFWASATLITRRHRLARERFALQFPTPGAASPAAAAASDPAPPSPQPPAKPSPDQGTT